MAGPSTSAKSKANPPPLGADVKKPKQSLDAKPSAAPTTQTVSTVATTTTTATNEQHRSGWLGGWRRKARGLAHASMQSLKKLKTPGASDEKRSVYINSAPPLTQYDKFGRYVPRFVTNEIHTNKYSLLSFIPRNLYEQFRRLANFYFLMLVVLQCLPWFMVSAPLYAAAPITFIVIITGLKDMYEDIKRYQADKEINNTQCLALLHFPNLNITHVRLGPIQKFRTFVDAIGRGLKLLVSCGGSASSSANGPPKPPPNKVHDLAAKQGAGSRSAMGSQVELGDGDTDLTMVRLAISANERPAAKLILPPSTPDQPVKQVDAAVIPQSVERRLCKKIKKAPSWELKCWKDINVGDLILLKNNQPVPADIVILSTSEADGLCYIETKNLDGETNLKIRSAIGDTNHLKTVEDLLQFSCRLDAEPPNNNLYTFNGAIVIPNSANADATDAEPFKKCPVTINELLLRGCIIRNTDWIIGMVCCTGYDTKLIRNAGATPSKRSEIEKQMNPQVFANFILTVVLCAIIAVMDVFYTQRYESNNAIYLAVTFEDASEQAAYWLQGIFTFVSALIMLQNIVPISLYVTTEFVKLFQAYFISQDVEMYYEPIDVKCVPKTWNIADDLGQIEYVFSDKTGTLTRNVMEFRKCSIGGKLYGGYQTGGDYDFPEKTAEVRAKAEDGENHPGAANSAVLPSPAPESKMADGLKVSFDNPYSSGKLTFVDPNFIADLSDTKTEQHAMIKEFFTLLAVCHTVLADYQNEADDFDIVYKAQSPDEAALVTTAKDLGFTFVDRVSDEVSCNILGDLLKLKILNIIEFNSTRKRMSVIVSTSNGTILLYTKGADTVIYERLAKGQEKLKETTLRHLEELAEEGLRTLCLAYRILPKKMYQDWAVEYQEASASLTDREAKMDAAAEKIEQELTLIGATAIEDRLQDGVPECIAKLARGGIKIWVLTGDKMETAINIGFSCNLLTREMTLIIIKGTNLNSTQQQLTEALQKYFSDTAAPAGGKKAFALIIDGQSLKYALGPTLRNLLVDLGCRCKAVICCRVSPLQKAQVVGLINRSKAAMTLAIGDGANDVSMIQEANIGVGIQGQEGMQASMASDYAIGQFRYLNRLLLVHGRWSYHRTSEMTLLMFYKNMIWTIILFWFQIYCGFTAQLYFDYMFILGYNLVFTSLPPMILGFMDQDITDLFSLAFPPVYKIGIRKELYGLLRFFIYMADGFYQSAACFWISYFAVNEASIASSGYEPNLLLMGTVAATIAVINANTYMGMCMLHWTWLAHFVVWGSSLFFIGCVLVYSQFTDSTLAGVETNLYGTAVMWLCVPLSVVVCLLPRYLIMFMNRLFRPSDVDVLREVQKYRTDELNAIMKDVEADDLPLFREKSTFRRRKPSRKGPEEIEMEPVGASAKKKPTARISNATDLAHRINQQFDKLGKNIRKATSVVFMRTGTAGTATGFAFSQEPGVANHLQNLSTPTEGTLRRQQGVYQSTNKLETVAETAPAAPLKMAKPPPYWTPKPDHPEERDITHAGTSRH